MSMSYNDSIMESWFHRSRGVSGFIVSCVSWFHRFSGVNSFDTKLAILTYNEILTLLTVLYSTLYIYVTATCTTYHTDYIRNKNQKTKGAGKYGKF